MGQSNPPSRVALVESVRRLNAEQTLRLLPMIERIARKTGLPDPPFPLEDLVQEGAMACFEHVGRFDPNVTNAGKPVRLETFLYPRIWGAIQDYARRGYFLHGGRRRKPGQEARVERIESLSSPAENRGRHSRSVTVGDLVYDQSAVEPTLRLEQRAAWQEILRGFAQRERLLLLEYFVHGRTLKAIGEDLGLSESRCSQMLTGMLAKLRAIEAATGTIRENLAA